VIGGGNVAIDVARSAVRCGADSTAIYCLESRDEMPALAEEIEEAFSESIEINNGRGPKRILTENGKVCGVEFMKCVSVFDAEGRFAPRYDERETITVAADHVLLSVGQSAEWDGLLEGSRAALRPNGAAVCDDFTLQSDEPDIFIGGDALSGPKFAIDAIAMGKEGAISIHRFVQKGQDLVIGRDRREYKSLDKESAVIEGFDNTPRQRAPREDAADAARFRDGRGTFTEEQVKKETERCLGCGAVVRDEFLCVGCGQCVTKCKFDAIALERKYDGAGVAWEDIKAPVLKTVIKRKGRIAAKKIKDRLTGSGKKEVHEECLFRGMRQKPCHSRIRGNDSSFPGGSE
ncbi:MAG: FAD-dependent oxidoreductase, partial [Clostridiales Family XIII bacterium]|jgi:NAD-dependent dihydropyrimidine dehydrogenase PreA subunit|nr:FAD-dependent oxidoreductase [Clostridiales Family XIII bacterium]